MQTLRSSLPFAIEFKFIPGTNFDELQPINLVDTANENPQSVEESNFDFLSIHQRDQQQQTPTHQRYLQHMHDV